MWFIFVFFFVWGWNGNLRRRVLIGGGKVKVECENVYLMNLDLFCKIFFVWWN